MTKLKTSEVFHVTTIISTLVFHTATLAKIIKNRRNESKLKTVSKIIGVTTLSFLLLDGGQAITKSIETGERK